MENFDLNQIMIMIFGAGSIFLSQTKNVKLPKFACICGLISQPFFVYETFIANQTGMFILSVIITLSWGMGFVNFWVLPFIKNLKSSEPVEPIEAK